MSKKIRTIMIVSAITAVLTISAIAGFEPPVVTDHPDQGLISFDFGEWGELVEYTPSGPQPPTPGPSAQPTSSAEPTSPTISCEAPAFKWVMVSGDKAPLRYIHNYNQQGKPVFQIYGKAGTNERYVPLRGKIFCVFATIIKGDGGEEVYRIPSSQRLGGKPLPNTFYLYVPTRMVSDSKAP